MSSKDEQPSFNPELLFDKFKDYFNQKFDSLANSNKQGEDSGFKDLKNKIEAKALKRSGNSAQFEFCGQLEIAHDRVNCWRPAGAER